MFRSAARGSGVGAGRLARAGRALLLATAAALVGGGVAASAYLWESTTPAQKAVAKIYFQAWLASEIPGFPGSSGIWWPGWWALPAKAYVTNRRTGAYISDGQGRWQVWPEAIVSDPTSREYVASIPYYSAEFIGGGISTLIFGGVWGGAYGLGRRAKRDVVLRGGRVANKADFKAAVKKMDDPPSPITLGGVPLAGESERYGILAAGAIGGGKSTAFFEVLDTFRKNGWPAVVFDFHREGIQRYYDPTRGDVILNPMDARGAPCTLFADAGSVAHVEDIAATLIPNQSKTDPFWENAARALFSVCLRRFRYTPKRSMRGFFELVAFGDLEKLRSFVKGTEAESLISEALERTALSFRVQLVTAFAPLRFLLAEQPEHEFSIREWVEKAAQGHGGFLYLTCRADQTAVMRPLMTHALNVFSSALRSLPPDPARRIGLFCDELPEAGKISGLADLLNQGRKFGLCAMVGIQSPSQLRKVYGQDEADTLLGALQTSAIFSMPDKDGKEFGAERLGGKVERREVSESESFGGERMGSASLAEHRHERYLVMPAEIQNLRKHEFFLRQPWGLPVTRLTTVKPKPGLGAPDFVPGGEGTCVAFFEQLDREFVPKWSAEQTAEAQPIGGPAPGGDDAPRPRAQDGRDLDLSDYAPG